MVGHWTGIGRPGEDMGGQELADLERTWVDRHWQAGSGRGWTGIGRPGEDVGGHALAD